MSHHLLPSDLWCYIGFKLDSPGDRIRFRAVSRSWRSLLPFRQPPWLMLAQEEEEKHTESEQVLGEESITAPPPPPRGFVSLGDKQIYRIDFPELDKVRSSTGNWLITVHLDKTLRVLNPFTRQQIYLPSPRTFQLGYDLDARGFSPERYRDKVVVKVALSSPPSCNSGEQDWVAMAIHRPADSWAIARPGDASWTTVQQKLRAEDVIFYKHRFYAICMRGRLMACDLGLDPHLPQFSYLTDPMFDSRKDKRFHFKKHYLVECVGEMLYVVKDLDQEAYSKPKDYKTIGFQVYKLDWVTTKFIELNNLGEHSLFLGFNTSVSVRASDYYGLVKKNCIYFTDDYIFGYLGMHIPGGQDMGVFDLEDKSITPLPNGVPSTSLYSPPVWVVPI